MSTKTRLFPTLVVAFFGGVVLFSACSLVPAESFQPTPPVPVSTSSVDGTASPTAQQQSSMDTTTTFWPLTLMVPSTVASGASGSEYPRLDSEEAAWWQKTPGHLEVMLGDYYILQGKFHQPKIYIYPTQAYAEMVPPAFESLHRLNNILGNSSAPISPEQLPGVPFFNAQQVFASNIQGISFQNGSGVRFLTQYAQYTAPVNNHELFYHFQGVTRDGAYYVIAIFPVNAQLLADTSSPLAALPPGGIAYPDTNDPNSDWQGYYTAISNQLNAASLDTFTPAIHQLDALIQSMEIAP